MISINFPGDNHYYQTEEEKSCIMKSVFHEERFSRHKTMEEWPKDFSLAAYNDKQMSVYMLTETFLSKHISLWKLQIVQLSEKKDQIQEKAGWYLQCITATYLNCSSTVIKMSSVPVPPHRGVKMKNKFPAGFSQQYPRCFHGKSSLPPLFQFHSS